MNAPITLSLRDRNDRLRTTFLGGRVLTTEGIRSLGPEDQIRILHAVQHFNVFTEDNDPNGEHDFGVIELPGIPTVFWKIDTTTAICLWDLRIPKTRASLATC